MIKNVNILCCVNELLKRWNDKHVHFIENQKEMMLNIYDVTCRYCLLIFVIGAYLKTLSTISLFSSDCLIKRNDIWDFINCDVTVFLMDAVRQHAGVQKETLAWVRCFYVYGGLI